MRNAEAAKTKQADGEVLGTLWQGPLDGDQHQKPGGKEGHVLSRHGVRPCCQIILGAEVWKHRDQQANPYHLASQKSLYVFS